MGVGAHWGRMEPLPACEAIGPDGARVVIRPHAATDSVADLARALDLPVTMPLAIDDRPVAPTERLVAAGLRVGSRISIAPPCEPPDHQHRERCRGRGRGRARLRTLDHAAARPPHRRAGGDRSGSHRRPGGRVAPRHPRRHRGRDGRVHAADRSLPGDDLGNPVPARPPRRRCSLDRLESPPGRSWRRRRRLDRRPAASHPPNATRGAEWSSVDPLRRRTPRLPRSRSRSDRPSTTPRRSRRWSAPASQPSAPASWRPCSAS